MSALGRIAIEPSREMTGGAAEPRRSLRSLPPSQRKAPLPERLALGLLAAALGAVYVNLALIPLSLGYAALRLVGAL